MKPMSAFRRQLENMNSFDLRRGIFLNRTEVENGKKEERMKKESDIELYGSVYAQSGEIIRSGSIRALTRAQTQQNTRAKCNFLAE